MSPFEINKTQNDLQENLKPLLKGKKILLGITGSIAAFKACDIVRILIGCGASVRVVLTRGAENFVTPLTLETLSGSPVLTGFWSEGSPSNGTGFGTHHIDTARWADLILVAPATANIIAKTANGFADDLLSTEILAFKGPLCIAPAMNPAMFESPAVQNNIRVLKERGVTILGPATGSTSCGEVGLGRMLEPIEVVEQLSYCFIPKRAERILITVGPTRSHLDPVRYLTNRSSGIMGASLCWAAVQKGYKVTALCGSVEGIQLPSQAEVISTPTANEMYDAACKKWPSSEIFISCAAVLDWDISNPASQKLKKENGTPSLDFKKNPDILLSLAKSKSANQFVVGFAAETDTPIQNGIAKLYQKKCDALFVNDVSKPDIGFESKANAGWWITPNQDPVEVPQLSKLEIAHQLIDWISIATVKGSAKENSHVHH